MIYFASQKSDPALVKIGMTNDIARRMRQISAVTPVVLFATCEGDRIEERYFLKKFADRRVEGEWFHSDASMMKFIMENSTPCSVAYDKSGTRWSLRKPTSRKSLDGLVAYKLVKMVTDSYPRSMQLGKALEQLYVSLSERGDGWSRRRVRSIYEQTAFRVDLYEIVDLLELSGLPEAQWASFLRGDVHREILANLAEVIAPELKERNDD